MHSKTNAIKCNVENCIHHSKDNHCMANSILVAGSNAVTSSQTVCETFCPCGGDKCDDNCDCGCK